MKLAKMSYRIWLRMVQLNSVNSCLLCNKSSVFEQKVLRRFKSSTSVVHKASSLFVSNAAAQDTGAIELNLRLDEKLSQVKILKENLKIRRLDFDIDTLINDFKQMKMVESEKLKLESEKDEISQIMAQLTKTEETKDVAQSRDVLKTRGREVRDALRDINKQWWDLENKVILKALTLPNDLDHDTPVDKYEILDSAGEIKVSEDVKSHIEICKQFDLVKFSCVGPKAYYLKKDLAMTVQTLVSSVSDYLSVQGYSHITTPEMFRSRVAEGCGIDFENPKELYKLYDRDADLNSEARTHQLLDMLHLCGASLLSFAAYLTKMVIDRKTLPIRLFSVGTHYQPKNDLPGLFGALQSTKAVAFSGSEDATSSAEEFNKMKNIIWNLYKPTGFPVRLVQCPGNKLKSAESKRVEVQMWSPSLKEFVQVGFVSQHNDFVSRRLCCLHSVNTVDHKQGQHVYMVHGQVMDMTTMIACCLEYGTLQHDSWKIPEITIPRG